MSALVKLSGNKVDISPTVMVAEPDCVADGGLDVAAAVEVGRPLEAAMTV